MKFFKPIALVGALLTIAIACNHNNKALEVSLKREENTGVNSDETEAGVAESHKNKFIPPAQPADTVKMPPQSLQPGQHTKPGTKVVVDWDKKIIKTASINLEIKNYKTFTSLMRDDIKKFGGYVAQEEQNQNDYKIENSVTIKVPVDQFDDLVTELTKGEEKIIEKKISSEDVTTDIVDTKSRLDAKRQVRSRYLDLLKQAGNMQDILNVQNEINGIQEDIEAAAGRIEYLSHASSYSTINLTYFQILDASAKDTADVSYGTKLWQSFENGWDWVGDFFIGVISIWPLFLFGFVCWFAYKKWLLTKMHKRNG